MKKELSAEIIPISNNQKLLEISNSQIPLSNDIPEWLSPIPSIVAGLFLAFHLTCAKGLDPDKPTPKKK